MTTEIATYQPQAMERLHPKQIIEQATEEADALASVIEKQKLYSTIQGRRFVKCEGWTTLAALRGCLPREVGVQEEAEGRYIAKVDLVRMSDGQVLTSASAECGGPEDPVWQNRPPNARRSMAITRATGKACRVAFSWVMALSGFEVTPAEEMDHVGPNERTAQELGAARPEPKPRPTSTAATIDKGPVRIPGISSPFIGILMDHDFKEGVSADNKAWTVHIFRDALGEEWNTYSSTLAKMLHNDMGKKIELHWEVSSSGKYRKIIEYRVL